MLPCNISGSGPVIVLLHGYCEDKTCFNEQVFLLKDRYTVVVPDLPGFGEAPVYTGLTMEQMADVVEELLKQHAFEEVVLFGHSMGGYVTLAYAKKYVHRLRGFGLIHSTAASDSEERRQKRDQAIKLIQDYGVEPYVKNFIPPLFAPEYNDPVRLKQLIDQALQYPAEALTESLQAMKNREDSFDLLRSTSLPVLFISGMLDALIPYHDNLEQVLLCNKADIHLLPSAAHMGHIEVPEACATTLADFAAYCFGIT